MRSSISLLRDAKGAEGLGRAACSCGSICARQPARIPTGSSGTTRRCLLEQSRPGMVLAAAETFVGRAQAPGNRSVIRYRSKLRETLTAISEDGDRAPELRVEAAVATPCRWEKASPEASRDSCAAPTPICTSSGVLGMARVGLSGGRASS